MLACGACFIILSLDNRWRGKGPNHTVFIIQFVRRQVLDSSCSVMSIIDDQDLSKVVYNGTWVKGGSVNEYAGTVASSTKVGDSFTVTFKGKCVPFVWK